MVESWKDFSVSSLGFIEKSYCVRILLLLRQNGPLCRTDLYQLLSGTINTILRRIPYMISLGLVNQKVVDGISNNPKKVLSLTEYGQKVADSLYVAALCIEEGMK